MKKRTILVGLLTTVLMLSFIWPAFANEPTVEIVEVRVSDPFDVKCRGFKLDFEEDFTARTMTFYDKDGAPVRFQSHFEFDGTVTNTKTGTVFRSHAKGTVSEDLIGDGGVVERGLFVQVKTQSEGVVAIIAGKIVFDTTGDFVSFVGVTRPPPDLDPCDAIGDI